MLKKISFSFLLLLLVLTLMPQPAKATSTGLQPGTLIKGTTPSIYYYGADNKRYVFPNEKTYKTWFVTFNVVVAISNELLGEIPIGGNVTYKPGVKLVKITTDPKVYYVDKEGTLRHISSEALAKQLWGNAWYALIDDLPDPFFVNYKTGAALTSSDLPPIEYNYSINQDKTLSSQPDPASNLLSNIQLSGEINNSIAYLTWAVQNLNADSGFKVVMANEPDPVYPGNFYHYLSNPSTRSDAWYELGPGIYYFRVCQYLDGKCGVYSNNLALTVGSGSSSSNTGNKTITLKLSASSANSVNLEWVTNFNSPYGYKVVKSINPNPVYPGNDYHYIDNANIKVDNWTVSYGTWHFRVCEYLNGSCGIYSNDLTVKIQ